MKRIPQLTLVFLILYFLPGLSLSSSGQVQKNEARKFDEFGDVYPSDMAARLDFFAVALQNEPTANGFVFAYRSRRDLPGLSSRHVHWIRSYLVDTRGMDADRIKAIDGGVASTLGYELWIVPPGKAPTPRSDAYASQYEDRTVARKFDEFPYLTHDDATEGFAGFFGSVEGLADALGQEPTSLAYLIVYAQYDKSGWYASGRRFKMDPAGTAQQTLRRKKAELIKLGILPSRIRLVNGGYRKTRAVELWIVPRGERAPIATPNAFPPARARGKSR